MLIYIEDKEINSLLNDLKFREVYGNHFKLKQRFESIISLIKMEDAEYDLSKIKVLKLILDSFNKEGDDMINFVNCVAMSSGVNYSKVKVGLGSAVSIYNNFIIRKSTF